MLLIFKIHLVKKNRHLIFSIISLYVNVSQMYNSMLRLAEVNRHLLFTFKGDLVLSTTVYTLLLGEAYYSITSSTSKCLIKVGG